LRQCCSTHHNGHTWKLFSWGK